MRDLYKKYKDQVNVYEEALRHPGHGVYIKRPETSVQFFPNEWYSNGPLLTIESVWLDSLLLFLLERPNQRFTTSLKRQFPKPTKLLAGSQKRIATYVPHGLI